MRTLEEQRLYDAEYRNANRERLNELERTRNAADRDRRNMNVKRHVIKKKYGLTVEEYYLKLQTQECKCAICGIDISGKKKQQLDHDHATGAIRDFLCKNCNTALGGFQDSEAILMRAVEYLSRHRQGE